MLHSPDIAIGCKGLVLSDSETRLSGGGEERTREGRAIVLSRLDVPLLPESEGRRTTIMDIAYILCMYDNIFATVIQDLSIVKLSTNYNSPF